MIGAVPCVLLPSLHCCIVSSPGSQKTRLESRPVHGVRGLLVVRGADEEGLVVVVVVVFRDVSVRRPGGLLPGRARVLL